MKHQLVHRGLRVPRPRNWREAIYCERWAKLMARPVDMTNRDGFPEQHSQLKDILRNYPWPIDQRTATVCATFVGWFGCNGGGAILDQADRYRKGPWPFQNGNYILHAWIDHNRRSSGVNSGFRLIEAMLAPDSCFHQRNGYYTGIVRHPYLRQEDHEAIEHLCIWLDTVMGRCFLEGARLAEENESQRRHDKELAEFRAGTRRA